MFEILLFTAFTFLFLFAWYALHCNNLTYKQRNQILDEIFKDSINWRSRLDRYKQISYDTHMNRLLVGKRNWRSWYEG